MSFHPRPWLVARALCRWNVMWPSLSLTLFLSLSLFYSPTCTHTFSRFLFYNVYPSIYISNSLSHSLSSKIMHILQFFSQQSLSLSRTISLSSRSHIHTLNLSLSLPPSLPPSLILSFFLSLSLHHTHAIEEHRVWSISWTGDALSLHSHQKIFFKFSSRRHDLSERTILCLKLWNPK